MKKIYFAMLAMAVLTSCGDKNAKKDATSTDSLTTALAQGTQDSEGATTSIEQQFENVPLLVVPDMYTPDWYAPIAYTPQGSDKDLSELSDEERDKIFERHADETNKYYEWLKKNKERFVVLRTTDGEKKVSFVSANFDKGQEATIAMGWKGDERDEHMKYLRYRNESGVNGDGVWDAILVTESYAKTHKPMKVENTDYDREDEIPMPVYQVQELEKMVGKKVKKSRLNAKVEEDMYQFYTVTFEYEGNEAFAMQVAITRKGLVLGQMETTELDENGFPMWAVDTEDYPMIQLAAADDDGKCPNFWYLDCAPEHTELGAFRIVDDKLQKRVYSSNYMWY